MHIHTYTYDQFRKYHNQKLIITTTQPHLSLSLSLSHFPVLHWLSLMFYFFHTQPAAQLNSGPHSHEVMQQIIILDQLNMNKSLNVELLLWLPLNGEHDKVVSVSVCVELSGTYTPYGGGDEGKLQQAYDLTPWRSLTSCQHGKEGARDDEKGASFTTQWFIVRNDDFLHWDTKHWDERVTKLERWRKKWQHVFL